MAKKKPAKPQKSSPPRDETALRSAWRKIPDVLLRSPHLEASDIRLYGILSSYAGSKTECVVPLRVLADDMSMTIRGVMKVVERLAQWGVISVDSRADEGLSNRFILNDPNGFTPSICPVERLGSKWTERTKALHITDRAKQKRRRKMPQQNTNDAVNSSSCPDALRARTPVHGGVNSRSRGHELEFMGGMNCSSTQLRDIQVGDSSSGDLLQEERRRRDALLHVHGGQGSLGSSHQARYARDENKKSQNTDSTEEEFRALLLSELKVLEDVVADAVDQFDGGSTMPETPEQKAARLERQRRLKETNGKRPETRVKVDPPSHARQLPTPKRLRSDMAGDAPPQAPRVERRPRNAPTSPGTLQVPDPDYEEEVPATPDGLIKHFEIVLKRKFPKAIVRPDSVDFKFAKELLAQFTRTELYEMIQLMVLDWGSIKSSKEFFPPGGAEPLFEQLYKWRKRLCSYIGKGVIAGTGRSSYYMADYIRRHGPGDGALMPDSASQSQTGDVSTEDPLAELRDSLKRQRGE